MPARSIVSEYARYAGRCPGVPRARAAALAAALLVLSACSTVTPRPDVDRPVDAGPLLEEARAALRSGDYAAATDTLRRIDVLHADDPLVATARLEVVFAHYQAGEQAAAVAAAERFLRLHPDHPDIDYVLYVRGLARFAEALAELDRLPDGAGTPPTAGLAIRTLGEFVARFPDGRYSADVRSRIRHLEGRLVRAELGAAERALDAGNYAEAGLRAQALLEAHPGSGVAREAAVIVNMAHRMLNLRPAPPAADEGARAAPSGDGARTAADGPRRDDWIRAQDPAAFTLQLFGTSSKSALLEFIERHRIAPAAYFTTRRDGEPWYSLVHGVFASEGDARGAAERLPASMRGESPWIRRMSDIQALLAVEAAQASDPQ